MEGFGMDMVREQVKELRKLAGRYETLPYGREVYGTAELLKQAADTIEALSSKLAAANVARSDRHDGEEKKLIEAMAEEIENCYGRETDLSEKAREYLEQSAEGCGGGWIACEDRLPERRAGTTYLVCLKNGGISHAICLPSNKFMEISTMGAREFCSDNPVVAWQLLPEPYHP